jgi:hypothetical protein
MMASRLRWSVVSEGATLPYNSLRTAPLHRTKAHVSHVYTIPRQVLYHIVNSNVKEIRTLRVRLSRRVGMPRMASHGWLLLTRDSHVLR